MNVRVAKRPSHGRPAAGRRQERLARGNDRRPVGRRRAGARRFATTAKAFEAFLAGGLGKRIADRIRSLDPADVTALAACGAEIRGWIEQTPLPADVERDIRSYYQSLVKETSSETSFAVRSSATAEDLPDASFAGQQETFLNIRGATRWWRRSGRFTPPSITTAPSPIGPPGFEHGAVAISAAVQRMVRSDRGASGVMFTLDTESGFRDVVFITSSWGLGEMVVQGSVNPDEF
jgi:pyruvate,water dikinase